MKILLVAHPQNGGLSRYVHEALQECYPGRVIWIPSAPAGPAAKIQHFYNLTAWKERLVREIDRQKYLAAIFLNHLPEFNRLPPRSNNILWITGEQYLPKGTSLPYGRVYTSDPGCEEEIVARVGISRYGGVLPFACLPQVHQPAEVLGRKKTICFIGNSDAIRDQHLNALLNARGIPFTVVGDYFLRHRFFWRHPWTFWPSVANEKMGEIYARHKLALNIQDSSIRQGADMRTFECAGYNIPQIVHYREGIENYFEPGKEIEVYVTPEELPEKVRELAADKTRSIRMANRALQRASAEHTYQRRVRRIINEVLG